MGASDVGQIASHANVEIAALCDIDLRNLNAMGEKFPKAAFNRRGITAWVERPGAIGAGDAVDVVPPTGM